MHSGGSRRRGGRIPASGVYAIPPGGNSNHPPEKSELHCKNARRRMAPRIELRAQRASAAAVLDARSDWLQIARACPSGNAPRQPECRRLLVERFTSDVVKFAVDLQDMLDQGAFGFELVLVHHTEAPAIRAKESLADLMPGILIVAPVARLYWPSLRKQGWWLSGAASLRSAAFRAYSISSMPECFWPIGRDDESAHSSTICLTSPLPRCDRNADGDAN